MIISLHEALDEHVRTTRYLLKHASSFGDQTDFRMGLGLNALQAGGFYDGKRTHGSMPNGETVVDNGIKSIRVDLTLMAGKIMEATPLEPDYNKFVEVRKSVAVLLGTSLLKSPSKRSETKKRG